MKGAVKITPEGATKGCSACGVPGVELWGLLQTELPGVEGSEAAGLGSRERPPVAVATHAMMATSSLQPCSCAARMLMPSSTLTQRELSMRPLSVMLGLPEASSCIALCWSRCRCDCSRLALPNSKVKPVASSIKDEAPRPVW